MQDRVPTYPGRVRLIPVEGDPQLFTLERADEPAQIGTPINTATLLSDETALAIGLPLDQATVNNALSKLLGAALAAVSQQQLTEAMEDVVAALGGSSGAGGGSGGGFIEMERPIAINLRLDNTLYGRIVQDYS